MLWSEGGVSGGFWSGAHSVGKLSRADSRRRWVGRSALFFALLFTVPSRESFAQEMGSDDSGAEDESGIDFYDVGGSASLMASAHFLALDGLQTFLDARGFGNLPSTYLALGTGAFISVDHFLFGLETHELLSGESTGGANGAAIDGRFTFVNVAWLFAFGPVHLYPVVGVGTGSLTLSLLEGQPSFDDVLEGIPAGVVLEERSFLLQASANVDLLFAMGDAEESVRGFLLGLRLGYLMAPGGSSWTYNGVEIPDGPDAKLNSFFVGLTVGYGSWSAESPWAVTADQLALD